MRDRAGYFPAQFYKNKRSNTSNTVAFLEIVTLIVSTGGQFDSICFVRSRAFDLVSHTIHLDKRSTCGSSTGLANWRCSRIANRPDPLGLAVPQAVSRRLLTVAARARAKVRSCGICGWQSGNGASFLRVFRFPLPILIPPTAQHSSSTIIRGWYNRPNSGRRTKCTQSHSTPRKYNMSSFAALQCAVRCFSRFVSGPLFLNIDSNELQSKVKYCTSLSDDDEIVLLNWYIDDWMLFQSYTNVMWNCYTPIIWNLMLFERK
jgi:hypothetical protein